MSGHHRSARVDAVLGRRPVRLCLFLALAVWFFWAPLGAAHAIGESFDHRFYYALAEITRKLLVEQGVPPTWNPYFCGGIPHLGNPTVSLLVPTLPLVLIFGAAVGLKLTVVTVLVVGLEGGYRLARELGADAISALVAGPVFALSGEMAVWLQSGQDFLGVELLPWVLLAVVRAHRGDRRAFVGGALALAWMIGTVPAYPVLWCPLVVGPWALGESLRRAREGEHRRAVAAFAPPLAVAALGAALAGVRLVPMLEVFAGTPRRVVAEADATSPGRLWAALVDPSGVGHVGWIAIALAGVGLWAAPRCRGRLAALLVLFGLLALGSMGGAWDLLTRLPLYANLRYALRFVALLALPLAVLASLGVAHMRAAADRFRPGAGVLVAVLVTCAVAVELLPANRRMLGNPYVVAEVPRIARPFAQSRGNHWLNQLWARTDRGSIACYEETPFRTSAAVRGDLRAQERLVDPAAGWVRRERWTASEIDLAVRTQRPMRLLVNQNFDAGWRSSVGRVTSQGGALAVDLPAGRHTVRLRHRPASLWLGLALSAAGVATAVFFLRPRRKAG